VLWLSIDRVLAAALASRGGLFSSITMLGGSALTRVCSIFAQILQLIPRLEFESAVRQHNAERHARGFSSWGQFIAMLFCQLGHAKSLREICGGLAAYSLSLITNLQ
jgi:Domain of unknown function (DUF4372)